jgi:hypothetical protein
MRRWRGMGKGRRVLKIGGDGGRGRGVFLGGCGGVEVGRVVRGRFDGKMMLLFWGGGEGGLRGKEGGGGGGEIGV